MAATMAADRTTVLTLGGLSDQEAARMVAALRVALEPGGPSGASDVVGQAAGNPLFLEELASMVTQRGTADGIPRSIQALIAARLDLLSPDAKLVSQAAAVVGEVFWARAVTAVSPSLA